MNLLCKKAYLHRYWKLARIVFILQWNYMWSLLFTQHFYCKMKNNFVYSENEKKCVYQQSNLLLQ